MQVKATAERLDRINASQKYQRDAVIVNRLNPCMDTFLEKDVWFTPHGRAFHMSQRCAQHQCSKPPHEGLPRR